MPIRFLTWLGLIVFMGLPGGGPRLRLHLLASHVAVGQTFAIEVRAAQGGPAGGTVTVSAETAAGKNLWRRELTSATGDVWSLLAALPAPGRYRVVARAKRSDEGRSEASEDVTVIPPPPSYYGGVLAVGQWGLPDALQEALRDHGFAVQNGLTQGAPRVMAIADPLLGGSDPAKQYRAIWQTVAEGANLLLLSPPAPDALKFWPFQARLVPYRAGCGSAWSQGSAQLTEGLPATATADVLRPDFAFDLSQAGAIELEDLRQHLLVRGGDGYPGCHAWFRFRYGEGLVTVSTVPVLERGSDAYMRRYLMNLLKVASAAPRGAAKPGLAAAFARH